MGDDTLQTLSISTIIIAVVVLAIQIEVCFSFPGIRIQLIALELCVMWKRIDRSDDKLNKLESKDAA